MMIANNQQNPSASDAIMASALLAFSRNNNDVDVASRSRVASRSSDAISFVPSIETANSLPADAVAITSQKSIASNSRQSKECTTDWQFNVAFKNAVTNGETLKHLMQTSTTLTQSMEPHASQLAQFHAAMIQDPANVAAFYNVACYNSPRHFVTPPVVGETHSSGSKLNTEQTLIRQKEIEKALHSKPQRGRKRANLNEVERLELTRTRNREHAKSTRVRKKIRYEELLDCEARIRAIEKRQELEHRRRCCIVKFLSLQEQMIHDDVHRSTSVDSELHVQMKSLFQENGNALLNEGSSDNDDCTTTEQIQKFVRSFLCGINIVANRSSIRYKMKDSTGLEDIALSQNGTSFVEVDVASDNVILQSHVLKISFASESDLIKSIVLLPLARSGITNIDSTNVENEVRQNLQEQISYPSVVSLDMERDSRKIVNNAEEKRCESDDRIGMSF